MKAGEYAISTIVPDKTFHHTIEEGARKMSGGRGSDLRLVGAFVGGVLHDVTDLVVGPTMAAYHGIAGTWAKFKGE
jgi:hypothetical protein